MNSLNRFPNVRHIVFANYVNILTDDNIHLLEGCVRLERLEIYHAKGISDDGMTVFENLPKLKFLRMANCVNITDAVSFGDFTDQQGFHFIQHLTELEQIILFKAENITDNALSAFSELRHLKHIKLKGANLSNKALSHVAHLPLQSFEVCP
eukprot:TRINITY_DN4687_c0_g1_i1.p1 TRINITY_DN4687_c0_g1~~TRINITY_DN4687_c0_g1_i1.p1  ORF type:complete len:152 (-),score=15.90 TRINITY_DN4687_c0_g1_i1:11-466(-)